MEKIGVLWTRNPYHEIKKGSYIIKLKRNNKWKDEYKYDNEIFDGYFEENKHSDIFYTEIDLLKDEQNKKLYFFFNS